MVVASTLGARHLCYVFWVCVVCGEVHLSAFVSYEIEMPCKCVNSADNFCYICGEIIFASRQRDLTPVSQSVYFLHFGCKVATRTRAGLRACPAHPVHQS